MEIVALFGILFGISYFTRKKVTTSSDENKTQPISQDNLKASTNQTTTVPSVILKDGQLVNAEVVAQIPNNQPINDLAVSNAGGLTATSQPSDAWSSKITQNSYQENADISQALLQQVDTGGVLLDGYIPSTPVDASMLEAFSKYINTRNPATGMYWTMAEIVADSGFSAQQVYDMGTMAQQANQYAVTHP